MLDDTEILNAVYDIEYRLEQINRRVYIREVVTEINVEPVITAPTQLGRQTVVRSTHGEMLVQPVFEPEIDLEHGSRVLVHGQIEKVKTALELQFRRDVVVREKADRRKRQRDLFVHNCRAAGCWNASRLCNCSLTCEVELRLRNIESR